VDVAAQTVLVAGGTSGIGLELSRRFAAAGSTVIVGGRRAAILDKLASEGFATVALDVTDADSVERARDAVLGTYSDLSMIVTMSGVVISEDLRDPSPIADAEIVIATNLLGTIRLVNAFTSHLLQRAAGTIMTVSSASAFVPLPTLPTYAASKAGVHIYSEALRAQLDGTGVQVVELVPPAVTTTPEREAANPDAMRLTPFIDEVMRLLAANPTPDELLVDRVRPIRWADRDGTYAQLFADRKQEAGGRPAHQMLKDTPRTVTVDEVP
jgi:uncharacterized oxidoreductase